VNVAPLVRNLRRWVRAAPEDWAALTGLVHAQLARLSAADRLVARAYRRFSLPARGRREVAVRIVRPLSLAACVARAFGVTPDTAVAWVRRAARETGLEPPQDAPAWEAWCTIGFLPGPATDLLRAVEACVTTCRTVQVDGQPGRPSGPAGSVVDVLLCGRSEDRPVLEEWVLDADGLCPPVLECSAALQARLLEGDQLARDALRRTLRLLSSAYHWRLWSDCWSRAENGDGGLVSWTRWAVLRDASGPWQEGQLQVRMETRDLGSRGPQRRSGAVARATRDAVLAAFGQFGGSPGRVELGHGLLATWSLLQATEDAEAVHGELDTLERLGYDGLVRLCDDERFAAPGEPGTINVGLGEQPTYAVGPSDLRAVAVHFHTLASRLHRMATIAGDAFPISALEHVDTTAARVFLALAEEEGLLHRWTDEGSGELASVIKPLPRAWEIRRRLLERLGRSHRAEMGVA